MKKFYIFNSFYHHLLCQREAQADAVVAVRRWVGGAGYQWCVDL